MSLGVAKAGISSDAFDAVKGFFESFGYKVLKKPDPQDNDCDMYVVGEKRAIKVEIKQMRILGNGVWQVPKISANQRGCDVCAVLLPNGAVFVEKMEQYLKTCSDEGYKSFTWLKL
jgi:hypothetical protein